MMRSMDLYLKVLNRFDKTHLWKRYSKLCQKAGLVKPYFILSFDCDTNDDIEVVWDVHQKLMDLDIKPVYAVPGALLQRGEAVYGRILETGSEFMNHGGREHTFFDNMNNRYASCFFYQEQSKQEIEEDIYTGHEILKKTLSITPKGFRTPHFGTFQSKEQLNFLYNTIMKLNYSYSSSTVPFLGFKNGPRYKTKGILEIPVTGSYSEPFNILDSWRFFASPLRQHQANDYLMEIKKMCFFLESNPLFLNIYADPSHIYHQPLFFEAMAALSKVAMSINYQQLLEIS